ncbi:MAG TPA: site-2 protease family protein [Anaerolineae bacterium]|nr:site-2 protease family protein [Anaerolineae bacterium]HOR00831.1 site-2 protease family protein [Anaerolineae bacterium]
MRAWTIGRIAGIRIRVDWTWSIIFILITVSLAVGYYPIVFPGLSTAVYWGLGVISSLLLFASVLGHELAHSLVASRQGLPVDSITLFVFGGVSQIEEEPRTAGDEFRMAVVGPATSLVLGGIFYGAFLAIRPASGAAAAVAQYMGIINIALGAFNLLPGFPLDGGRVLRAILWGASGDLRRSTRIASLVGQGFAFLLIFVGIALLFSGNFIAGIWLAFIGWFLNNAAVASYRELIVRQTLEGVQVRRLMTTDIDRIPEGLTIEQVIDQHILSGRQHAYPVTRDGELVGLICLHDIRQVPREGRTTTTVAQAMTPYERLRTIGPTDDLAKAISELGRGGYEQLPVIDAPHHLAGLLRRRDVIGYLHTQSDTGKQDLTGGPPNGERH